MLIVRCHKLRASVYPRIVPDLLKKIAYEMRREDYIDLLLIFENLYMNPERFLRGIKNVEIRYA